MIWSSESQGNGVFEGGNRWQCTRAILDNDELMTLIKSNFNVVVVDQFAVG